MKRVGRKLTMWGPPVIWMLMDVNMDISQWMICLQSMLMDVNDSQWMLMDSKYLQCWAPQLKVGL